MYKIHINLVWRKERCIVPGFSKLLFFPPVAPERSGGPPGVSAPPPPPTSSPVVPHTLGRERRTAGWRVARNSLHVTCAHAYHIHTQTLDTSGGGVGGRGYIRGPHNLCGGFGFFLVTTDPQVFKPRSLSPAACHSAPHTRNTLWFPGWFVLAVSRR